ncbi:MAG: SH3 domain-containing protein, partial [Anaerolinea sp.]|nr:SH3 domain-containing protein [Anaerolinea sp.]
PPASATYTAVPSTNTPAATTSAATPSGGFLPTAAPCSTAPTIQIRNTTNARSGPGTDYAVVAQLAAGDVRPIVGRAASAPWWLIRLADGTQGWVADLAVQVQGYTGAVPLVTAPAINGATPTPGAAWNPTPQPGCNFTPVATATPTATAAPLTTTNQTSATTPEDTAAAASASDTTPATPLPTPTTIAPPPLPGANQEIASNTAIGSSSNSNTGSGAGSGSRSSTVEPVNMTASSLLPIIGIVLIAAGGIGLFALRRHARA